MEAGNSDTVCPHVTKVSWGEVRVGNKRFKDAKVFPGGVREWDWLETGTHHKPGIQPADVVELIAAGAKTIILTTGMWNYLHVHPDTLAHLEKCGIECHVLQTEKAVQLYNQLRATQIIAILIHSTC